MGAHLHLALEEFGAAVGRGHRETTSDRVEAGPAVTGPGELAYGERRLRANHHGVVHRAHFEHEARAPVGRGPADTETLALPDRVARGTVVGAQLLAVTVDDRPFARCNALAQPRLRVAVGNEADVVAVGLLRDGKSALGSLSPYDRLRRGRAEREHRVRKLLRRQHAENVRLIFGLVGGAVQLAVAGLVGDDVGVVPGGDRVESECERLLQYRRELDALVASHAGVGRAARGVLGDEVSDDVVGEALREIPDIERDAQLLSRTTRIQAVFNGAAATTAGAQRARHATQRQVHPHHIVPGVDRARRRHGAIDATAHRCQNPHGSRVRGSR